MKARIMFCTKCGAQIFDNENFCSKCGSPVKGRQPAAQESNSYFEEAERRSQNDIDAPLVINITPEKAAEMFRKNSSAPESAAKSPKKPKKVKNKGALGVVAVLLLLIVLLTGVGIASNCLNATTPQEIIDAIADAGENDDDSTADVSVSEESTTTASAETTSTAETTTATTTTTTTTTVTTTTTTTTAKPTTTTTTARTSSEQAVQAQQARDIVKLLVSKKWKTTVSGYDAVITFYKDGTALIEADVKIGFFTVTQKVEATYEVSSRCFAVIKGEYNGMQLGISGIISKISDDELLVDRGGDLGTITLKAV